MTGKQVVFNLKPLSAGDIPDSSTPEFTAFMDAHFEAGQQLARSMDEWTKHSSKPCGVQILTLPSGKVRNSLGINEYWCGRMSTHTAASLQEDIQKPQPSGGAFTPMGIVRTVSKRLSFSKSSDKSHDNPLDHSRRLEERRPTFELDDVERQQRIMTSEPHGLYESFRRGLLEYHSENEREYIEACRETSCLEVLQPHVAEIWRMTYITPAPASPRTFVTLLLSRELKSTPHGERSFMNISLPFTHPSCVEKKGEEKARVRGKYVSVELVSEHMDGSVEWRMATSSDAGGNIPRFITNSSLPKSIAEDVPSFLGWMWHRFPVTVNQANGV